MKVNSAISPRGLASCAGQMVKMPVAMQFEGRIILELIHFGGKIFGIWEGLGDRICSRLLEFGCNFACKIRTFSGQFSEILAGKCRILQCSIRTTDLIALLGYNFAIELLVLRHTLSYAMLECSGFQYRIHTCSNYSF